MRTFFLFQLALWLTPLGAASAREWPLWDGHETVEVYAKKVNLPPTKSLDLGNGVTLDLVLIPAGQFIMGTPEPAKPTTTIEEAIAMIAIGGILTVILFIVLRRNYLKVRKRIFSLGWLLLLSGAIGIFVGGIARGYWVKGQQLKYEHEIRNYDSLSWNEKRTHSVTLTQPFYMGKYTVTQAQYEAVIGKKPSYVKGAKLPVETVSWNDATEFCNKLNTGSSAKIPKGMEVRLPTEAQWEYACRAGTQTHYYSGNLESDLDAVAWYSANSGGQTHPVGEKKANAFGLYDMHGNVCQWCQDWYSSDDDRGSLTRDPQGPATGTVRALHGSSWNDHPRECRSALRNYFIPETRYILYGFRIVMNPDF